MQCYFVTWREGLDLGMTQVVLTELEEHMINSKFTILKLSTELGMILANIPGIVNCFRLDHLLSIRPIRQMIRSTNISVLSAWIRANS